MIIRSLLYFLLNFMSKMMGILGYFDIKKMNKWNKSFKTEEFLIISILYTYIYLHISLNIT